MRERIINGLNDLLEIDHDAVAEVMTLELILPIGSGLAGSLAAYEKEGVKMVNPLTLINSCIDDDPIVPVFENRIIQRFE